MAFDLNKNDGSYQNPSTKKTTSSKFNLSKEPAESNILPGNASKSRSLILGLIGVLIVGGGVLYYTVDTRKININNTLTAKAPVSDSLATSSAIVEKPIDKSSSNGSVQSSSIDEINKTLALNHKVPVTFKQGSSSFESTDRLLIKRIVQYLTKNKNASINVNGYASSDGPLALNQHISQARADAFKKYLISKNIEKNRIIASGKGIENPIASNENKQERRKNRRIEIIFSEH